MGKKSRNARVSPKQNSADQGKFVRLSKKYKNGQGKRKAAEETQIGNKGSVPKKVRFSMSNDRAPESPKESISVSDITKTQKRDKQKLPRFLKPELRTIKKTGIFKKVQPTASGKPNWVELKKESLKLKQARKEKKLTHFEIIVQSKKIWESVRHEKCPVDKRAKEIVKLHSVVENQLNKLVFAHDTSRIVQWLIKLGSPSVRTSICDELVHIYVEMMQKKFSAHVVGSILKYGDEKSKTQVIESMKGSILKLLTNSVSAPLIELMYSELASPEQKKTMEKEFLGNFLLTMNVPTTESIVNILRDLSAENKAAIFETVKENIIKVITKGHITSLLCSITLHFTDVCSQEDKLEILPLFSPHILDLAGKTHGGRLGMKCVWFSNTKVRKQIIKTIKGNILTLALSDKGFWIILTLLDAVDDTVLLNKVVVAEIAKNATELLKTESGRKVLLYLVAHRDPVYFHPQDIENLKQGDNFCLKSMDKKREELSPVINDILQGISKEINVWMENAKVAMVTLAILKRGQGEKLCEALQTLAKYICSDVKINNQPLIENPGMNLVLKKLLKWDETRRDHSDKFSVQLASVLEEETIKKWTTGNRGSFLIVGIIETKTEEAIKTLMTKITRPIREHICKARNVGSKVLVRALKEATPDLDDWDLLIDG